jgi:N-acetyl-gamma-glutamyl-phosphate reductase
VHQDLIGETDLLFSGQPDQEVDLVFLCGGHGQSRSWLEKNSLDPQVKVIDLSSDFRIESDSRLGERSFVYGLPEQNRATLANAQSVANPGCFATAIQLAILPLISIGHVADIHVTGITGSTGAGQSLSATSHFSWRTDNVQAYKTLTHQHLAEIRQTLGRIHSDFPRLHFIPWRGNFARGIFISAQTTISLDREELYAIYQNHYRHEPFVLLTEQDIHLKQVVNTNKCLLQLVVEEDQLVIHAALDNLLKGASGQAVQNMNILFGLEESTGLRLKPSSF